MISSNNPDPANPDFGKPLRQFDYGTISDAIVHVKYTAREDVGAFKNAAVAHLREYFREDDSTHSVRLFNLRQEFPTEWHRFLNPTDPANGNIFELALSPDLFPLRDQGKTLKVNTIWLLARCTDQEDYPVAMTPPFPAPDSLQCAVPLENDQYGGLHFSQKDVARDRGSSSSRPAGQMAIEHDPSRRRKSAGFRGGGGISGAGL